MDVALPASAEVRRAVSWVVIAAAAETALTIAHFLYGAHIYDDPSRDHVIVPALVSLGFAAALGALFAWRPSPVTLWPFVAVVAVPFVGMFGLYHGGFGHVCKLVLFAMGTSPERLEEIFDSPDFAAPNDVAFEVSGVTTLLAALLVTYLLVRLLRTAKRARDLRADDASTSTAHGA
jgi:hypothetical protein